MIEESLPSRAGERGSSGNSDTEGCRLVVVLEYINGGVGRLESGT
jgi:hypothetical protein